MPIADALILPNNIVMRRLGFSLFDKYTGVISYTMIYQYINRVCPAVARQSDCVQMSDAVNRCYTFFAENTILVVSILHGCWDNFWEDLIEQRMEFIRYLKLLAVADAGIICFGGGGGELPLKYVIFKIVCLQ